MDELYSQILKAPDEQVWKTLLGKLQDLFCVPLPEGEEVSDIRKREEVVASWDLLLSACSWELWKSWEKVVPRTSQKLQEFWRQTLTGKAILILDGLSLRELPFLLQEGKKRGWHLKVTVTGAELPPDTTHFAKSLGFPGRSHLENNRGKSSHFPHAQTDSGALPWKEYIPLFSGVPACILWHHWPDEEIHRFSSPGQGLKTLLHSVRKKLTSDDFWQLIQSLATGRKLVITSDHGYVSTANFKEITDAAQREYLQQAMKGGRYSSANPQPEDTDHWLPPLTLSLTSQHGTYTYVLGRRKWKVAGGYPTLLHGGLSLLEVVVPYIEIGPIS